MIEVRPGVEEPPTRPIDVQAVDDLAVRLLADLRTKLGGLQIDHSRRVADAVRATGDDQLVAAALLHDVVEKGCTTLADLLAVTDDSAVVTLVDLLSRRDGEAEEDYLSRCAADPRALVVKRADLADKRFLGDARVTAAIAHQVRLQAEERLVLLDRLAGDREGSTTVSTISH